MVKRTVILCLLLHYVVAIFAQADTVQHPAFNKKRLWIVAGANAAFYTASFIALNKAWYEDFPKTKFHFFNDNTEWNQMDKAGHVWTTYHVSRFAGEMWKWTGLTRNQSAIMGGVSGMLYQSVIEIQDAYSAQWGFSWGDVGANIVGAGMYVLQETGWKDQRIQVKFTYWPASHPEELMNRRDELFGSSGMERILKDYNSQTYWISGNLSSFFSESKLPRWLNIAIGYGAKGMYGGRINQWIDKEGIAFDYSEIKRVRLFYLSPDIDLTRISTQSKFLKTMFFILNFVKIPAPALQLSSDGSMRVMIK